MFVYDWTFMAFMHLDLNFYGFKHYCVVILKSKFLFHCNISAGALNHQTMTVESWFLSITEQETLQDKPIDAFDIVCNLLETTGWHNCFVQIGQSIKLRKHKLDLFFFKAIDKNVERTLS